jgi:hypothetical protein
LSTDADKNFVTTHLAGALELFRISATRSLNTPLTPAEKIRTGKTLITPSSNRENKRNA